MSGVKNIIQAQTKGVAIPTNAQEKAAATGTTTGKNTTVTKANPK